jgi:hypothetical protein
VAEGSGLLNRQTRDGFVGSNPTSSANADPKAIALGSLDFG